MIRPVVGSLMDKLSKHLDAILAEFKPGAKVTVIIRCPWLADGDTVIGNDDITEAVKVATRMLERTEELRAQGGLVEPTPVRPELL